MAGRQGRAQRVRCFRGVRRGQAGCGNDKNGGEKARAYVRRLSEACQRRLVLHGGTYWSVGRDARPQVPHRGCTGPARISRARQQTGGGRIQFTCKPAVDRHAPQRRQTDRPRAVGGGRTRKRSAVRPKEPQFAVGRQRADTYQRLQHRRVDVSSKRRPPGAPQRREKAKDVGTSSSSAQAAKVGQRVFPATGAQGGVESGAWTASRVRVPDLKEVAILADVPVARKYITCFQGRLTPALRHLSGCSPKANSRRELHFRDPPTELLDNCAALSYSTCPRLQVFPPSVACTSSAHQVMGLERTDRRRTRAAALARACLPQFLGAASAPIAAPLTRALLRAFIGPLRLKRLGPPRGAAMTPPPAVNRGTAPLLLRHGCLSLRCCAPPPPIAVSSRLPGQLV